MAKEIFLPHGVSGVTTLYATIRRPSDGFLWYTPTPAFEPYTSGHAANGYAIALAEEGTTGNYHADFPAGITAAGRYEVLAREQAGGSAAWPADNVVGTGVISWSGSAIVVPVAASSTGIVTATLAAGVADPGAPSAHTTIEKMIVALWRRQFRRVHKTPTAIMDYADDGTTVNATRAISDNGSGTQDVGAAS